MSGHTPGPWKARQIGTNAWRVETVPGGDYVPLSVALIVTTVLEVGVSYSDAADNARLIAAAPELADVLRDLVSECEAAQGPEIRDDPVWGPLLSKAVEVLVRIDNGNSDDQK